MSSGATDSDPEDSDPGVDNAESSGSGDREGLSPGDIKAMDLDNVTKDDLRKIPRTREHLSHLRVSELRDVAREECGPGTWISHASKDELIGGAIQGRPPRSTHKEDRGREPSEDSLDDPVSEDDGLEATLSARADDTGRSLLDPLLDLTREVKSEIKKTSEEELDEEDAKQAVLNSLQDGFPEELEKAVLGTVMKITEQVVERRTEIYGDRLSKLEEECGIDPSGEAENQTSGGRKLPEEGEPSEFEEDLGAEDPQVEGEDEKENSEVEVTQDYAEGSQRQVKITRYERDPAAREACIDHYGKRCYCCGLDLGEKYGEIGEGCIHVHHESPLSEVGDDHEVDPVRDLKPLCPNCHSVVHCTDPPIPPESLRQILEMIDSTG